MGRKQSWRGGLELLILSIFHHVVLADGDVGCLFSKNLCNSRTEKCYNDLAFGRCVPAYEELENDKLLYRYNLNSEELALLRSQLEALEIEGYKWPHSYTQCVMQTSLYNFRHGLQHDLRQCQHLRRDDDYDSPYEGEANDEDNILPPVAIVNFMPSNDNPHGEFADELYYPPGVPQEFSSLPEDDKHFGRSSYARKDDRRGRKFKYQIYRPTYLSNVYEPYEVSDRNYEDRRTAKKSVTLNELERQLNEYEPSRQRRNLYPPSFRKNGIESLRKLLEEEKLADWPEEDDDLEFLPSEGTQIGSSFGKHLDLESNEEGEDVEHERAFSRKYKHQRNFPPVVLNVDDFAWHESLKRNDNVLDKSTDYDDIDGYEEEGGESGQTEESILELPDNGLYTEGGFMQSMDQNPRGSEENVDEIYNPFDKFYDDDLNILLRRELAGFKRRERLDVKKPGPPFSTNNYAFKTQSPSVHIDDETFDENHQDNILLSPVKKEAIHKNSKTYENVDLDHVYIEFDQEFKAWDAGEGVVEEINRLLGLPMKTLQDVRVGRAEVTFMVGQNNKHFNSSDVINKLSDIRKQLQESLGYTIVRAGIGDKTKLPAALELTGSSPMNSNLFGALVAAGVAAACAAAVVTLFIVRRHAKSRAKLAGLTTPDPEASKDYQDLCRVRMQSKQPEKVESPRITTLARESESRDSSSNRSSTSSWSEEPTLSNMDISTGHMVLRYMEDHLKNKDRLDREWAALCAYEADPASIEIAQKDANAKLNRPGTALPYDHSRIVLNELTNANNSNYINASTIMDHDPRNPAYIATQGPLRETAADFWQLVWEQGSVVIVMLTRLTEDGHAKCYRYWPGEGSELYHIYEVHLVSEHFWCDDYLVRSFYLKNLRTGETRTVTQFHFLSWPENGVPNSIKALLEFRRKVNKSYRGRSCPIIIHCSDGAGRTGTYCLIDMVLNRMAKGANEIDIAATLEHIRDQRPHMVATKQQFEFVLMAVAEEVHAILKAMPVPAVEKTANTSTNSLPSSKNDQ